MRRCKLQGVVAQRYGQCERHFLAAYGEMDLDPMALRLYVARKSMRISRSAMARALGVHETSVMRWERGDIHTISKEHVIGWSRATGFTPRWLISGGPVTDASIRRMLRDMAPIFREYIEPLPDSLGIPSTPEQVKRELDIQGFNDPVNYDGLARVRGNIKQYGKVGA